MAKTNQSRRKTQSKQTSLTPPMRVALALAAPILGGVLLSLIAGGQGRVEGASNAPLFAGIGVASWFLGLSWYGIPGMGLRGKRPLFAGIGFATLGWVAFLITRFLFVEIAGLAAGSASAFLFILLFEAFALQLWTFGTLFHALAQWRGPLTAAVSSGIVFGVAGFLFFQESFSGDASGLVYFIVWGVFYGVVRLRTGSLLGVILIQALQSFTGWIVLRPFPEPLLGQLRPFYLVTTAAYLIFIWRLWPKEEADYRV